MEQFTITLLRAALKKYQRCQVSIPCIAPSYPIIYYISINPMLFSPNGDLNQCLRKDTKTSIIQYTFSMNIIGSVLIPKSNERRLESKLRIFSFYTGKNSIFPVNFPPRGREFEIKVSD